MQIAEYVQIIAVGIQSIAVIGGGMMILARAASANRELREDIGAMQLELKALSRVITEQAVQAERLNNQSKRMTMLEQRIEDMRRGRGYIKDHSAQTVEREY